jgi:hypothetical protein
MDSYTYVQISDYLPLNTLSYFIDILEKDIHSPELHKWIQIRYHRSATIISRFMRRIHALTHRTPEINSLFEYENIDHFPHFLKRKYMQMYFLEYTRQNIAWWYTNKNNWKDQIIAQYQRKTFQHPHEITRWDLWQLQKQMPLDEILVIGW